MSNKAELNIEKERRLKTLYEYKILDTMDEAAYDEINKLASQICNTPYSFISFLDKDRQWFKSVNGLYVQEISCLESTCFQWLIGKESHPASVLIHEDLTKDTKTKSALLKTQPEIKLYLSVPIVAPNGCILGTLCVLDTESRDVPLEKIIGLKTLADQIVNQLELARIHEEQNKLLIQYSKLSELGSYAATIAHEINNPLSTLSSKAALLEFQAEEDGSLSLENVKDFCKSFERNVMRISKIIKGLRNIGRDTRDDPFELVNIKEIVEDTLELCQKKISNEGVELGVCTFPDLSFECRSAQVSQVLLNLINNAFDAVQNLSQKWIKVDFFDKGKTFEIHITDSGKGIPEDIRNKIFSNFFTTKGVGKGTGIGLSVSSEIVKGHSGKLSVDGDCPNTKFVISLPKVQPKNNEKAA